MCGLTASDRNLCVPCLADLPRVLNGCRGCAASLQLGSDRLCGVCSRRGPAWHQAVAALRYEFPARELVCRFKFRRDLASGAVLADLLTEAVRAMGQELPDAIVPVPLHRLRLYVRTFNQSDFLARRVGRSLGIPVYGGMLRRVRHTAAQSGLDAKQRRRNTRGAFAGNRGRLRRAGAKHIALIDDVMTTGATLAACSAALRSLGVRRVSAWVVARAPGP
jgi:ComF family protein